ncbi:MAG: hypothetical protein ACU84Q_05740 [Gammaproteobacteria bacterium]
MSDHESVWQLLPWFVNGTLEGLERRLVTRHVNECLICKREVRGLSKLASAMRSRPKNVACENALAELHRRMNNKRSARTIPWAAAASLVVIVGLALIASKQVTDGLVDFSAGYQTLGADSVIRTGQFSRSARIVFRPDVDTKEMVSLLDAVDASIANGPSRRGAYTVSFSGTLSSDEQGLAIRNLRGSGRVLFVEPVAGMLNDGFYRN